MCIEYVHSVYDKCVWSMYIIHRLPYTVYILHSANVIYLECTAKISIIIDGQINDVADWTGVSGGVRYRTHLLLGWLLLLLLLLLLGTQVLGLRLLLLVVGRGYLLRVAYVVGGSGVTCVVSRCRCDQVCVCRCM